MSAAILVRADGSVSLVAADKQGRIPLDRMHAAMDVRTVDVIAVDRAIDAWVDDEGLMVADPTPNPAATYVIMRLAGRMLRQPIVGPVLFAGHDDEGYSIPLADEQTNAIVEHLSHYAANIKVPVTAFFGENLR